LQRFATIDIVDLDVVEAANLIRNTSATTSTSQGPTPFRSLCAAIVRLTTTALIGACSNACSNAADFAAVRQCSRSSKSWVTPKIRSSANGGERAAEDWGSRGRRFKSCHPDRDEQQVRSVLSSESALLIWF
jgi:hypothetical protein